MEIHGRGLTMDLTRISWDINHMWLWVKKVLVNVRMWPIPQVTFFPLVHSRIHPAIIIIITFLKIIIVIAMTMEGKIKVKIPSRSFRSPLSSVVPL